MKGGDILDFSKWGNLRKGEGVDYGIFVFVSCLESGALIVFWKFYEKIQRKNLRPITVSKKIKFSDFFFGIVLRKRIFLPSRYSAKESCKKWFDCALWAKSIKPGKKCISVYVITKMNGNHFLPSSMKQVIRKQKMKNHFHEKFFVVWFDTHSYRELTIFAKAYLSNLKLIKQGEIQKLLPKNR